MSLQGGQLSGGNPINGRAELDYYATNPQAVKALFEKYNLSASTYLEPCVGGGHVANEIKKLFGNDIDITCLDIVDRGYEGTVVTDYLKYDTGKKYECIVTNPPFSFAEEFIKKSIELLDNNGKIAMFLKLQFLEGAKREKFFKEYPPKYIYVFRKRMATWRCGSPINPETGKKWAETICFAWFIWEKQNGEMIKTEPIVRWL